jgi:sulfonate transport system ATP-binding protein
MSDPSNTLLFSRPLIQPTAESKSAAIKLQQIKKSYGTRRVLKGIDLDIQAGEFIAVIGRSGCGKSTLLRLLGGLEQSDAGTITFSQTQTDTRMMFQEARLLPWKNVLDNVALGLQVPRKEAQQIAHQALRSVGLAERWADWPAVLSGGQRQRVALARALVHHPALLLLDEPLGALDALTRLEMQGLIASLWQQQRFTAVLVTHDVQEAIALADRVILIEHGQITLNEKITLPRPRSHGDAAFGKLEERILQRVLNKAAAPYAEIRTAKALRAYTKNQLTI